MKNIFVIICSIIIPVYSLKEVTPNLCINCKFFMNSFIIGNEYGKCSLFPKTEKDIDYFVTGIKKRISINFVLSQEIMMICVGKKVKNI